MNNSIDNDWIKTKLESLGYRKSLDVIASCVARLDEPYNESPWQLYMGKTRIVSQELGRKIGRDFDEGKLDFLKSYHVDDILRSRDDGFRETRYHIVIEAEKMAPHKWWNIRHMRSIGISADDARKLLTQYDEIRTHRERAEIIIDNLDRNGEKTEPTKTVMARFRTLPTYLTLLYQMYCRTTYPEAPDKWVNIASELRMEGELQSDRRLVDAGDDIMRYQVWEKDELMNLNPSMTNLVNLDAYFDSLERLFKPSKKSYDTFILKLRKKFGIR